MALKQSIDSKQNMNGALPVKDKMYLHVRSSCMRVIQTKPVSLTQLYLFNSPKNRHNYSKYNFIYNLF